MTKGNLVLVTLHEDTNKKPYLFTCGERILDIGEEVIVDTVNGEKRGNVIAFLHHWGRGEDTDKMIQILSGASDELRRVISRVEYSKFTYEEETE